MNCPPLEGPAAVIILVVLGSPLFYVRLVEHSFFALHCLARLRQK